MRIAVVTCWYPTDKSPGAGSFVERDVRALATRHEVRVIHLVSPHLEDGKKWVRTGGVPVTRLPMSTSSIPGIVAAAARLRPLLKGCDVIHTMAAPSLLPLRLMGRLPAPVVHTEHWSGIIQQFNEPAGPLHSLAVRAIYRRPAHVSAVSSFLAAALGTVAAREVGVISNIVDAGPFCRHARAADDHIRLIAIGSVTEMKGPMLALSTVSELQSRGWKVGLTWVGDGELRSQYEREAQDSGIEASFTGFLSHEQAMAALSASDILLHPSKMETFSIAAAESLIMGRPIVIEPRGGHRDFAISPWAQFAEDRTASAYADAVERALLVPIDGSFENYSESIRQKLSEESVLDSWDRVYEKVTG